MEYNEKIDNMLNCYSSITYRKFNLDKYILLDDFSQDCKFQTFKALNKYSEDKGSLKTFLISICRNEGKTVLRTYSSKKRTTELGYNKGDNISLSYEYENNINENRNSYEKILVDRNNVDNSDLKLTLDGMLKNNELDATEIKILLYYMEGYSQTEIAKMLGTYQVKITRKLKIIFEKVKHNI